MLKIDHFHPIFQLPHVIVHFTYNYPNDPPPLATDKKVSGGERNDVSICLLFSGTPPTQVITKKAYLIFNINSG